MRIALMLLLLLTCAAVSAAQSEAKCFRSDWLQGERSVKLEINGSKVSGTFLVASGDDSPGKSYRFTGMRRGQVLTVVFENNQRPDVSPAELRSLVWTLVKRGKQELLRIKIYGKNYDTNKYENSFAYFEPCATT